MAKAAEKRTVRDAVLLFCEEQKVKPADLPGDPWLVRECRAWYARTLGGQLSSEEVLGAVPAAGTPRS